MENVTTQAEFDRAYIEELEGRYLVAIREACTTRAAAEEYESRLNNVKREVVDNVKARVENEAEIRRLKDKVNKLLVLGEFEDEMPDEDDKNAWLFKKEVM